MLRLRPSLRGLAISLQGPRPGEADPFAAGVQAVLGAARNVACAGGEPIGLTDCLNFGNPEKPEIAWELAQAIEGIAQAAEALGIPVVSGNVSLYNETDGRPIPPTPVVGCVGLVPDVRFVPDRWESGDVVLLASAPEAGLAAEAALIRFLWKAAPLLSLCHDVGDGGLARALEEAARWSGRPAEVSLPGTNVSLGAAVLACAPARRREARLARARRDRQGALAMCGVFGVYAPDRDVARLTYFGLFALQHRGQESAGIAVSEQGRLTALRDLGLVTQVFNEQKLHGLQGQVAIGHTRYSTTGSSQWSNAQPLVQHGRARTVALGHNGNLVNASALRDELSAAGVTLRATSDSEVIAALIANDEAPLEQAVANTMARLEGAYSIVALSEGRLVAFRDPHGFRPLVLGRIHDDWVVASETCALDLVGADFVREVERGEVVLADGDGLRTVQAVEPASPGALCIFEFFYLARPDTQAVRDRGARRARAHGRAARAGGARRGGPRAADPRLRHARRDRLLARDWASRSARG